MYFFCHYKKEKVSAVNKLLYIDFCSAWVRFKCLIFFFFISYCLIFIYRFIYLFYFFIYSGLWEGANYTVITRQTVVWTPLKGLRQRCTPVASNSLPSDIEHPLGYHRLQTMGSKTPTPRHKSRHTIRCRVPVSRTGALSLSPLGIPLSRMHHKRGP